MLKNIPILRLLKAWHVSTILNDGLIAGMNVVGALFKINEVYVPEVLMAARAMHTGLAVIKPLIVSAGIKEKGVVAIGTVKGDMHDIGKNLVIMMLEGAGYKVIDLGIDTPAEKFLQAVEEQHPQVIGLSALLTTTMPQMQGTVEKLKKYGRSDQNCRRRSAHNGKVCQGYRRRRVRRRCGKRCGYGIGTH